MSSPRDTDVRNAPQRGRASSTGTVRGIRVDARSDEGGNQDPPATAEPKSGSRLEAAMKSVRILLHAFDVVSRSVLQLADAVLDQGHGHRQDDVGKHFTRRIGSGNIAAALPIFLYDTRP